MTRAKRQLGYNLVEIAIVLTASLMLASLLSVNSFQTQKSERDKETARAIESMKSAIVSYAAGHSAKPHVWVNGAATGRTVRWRLPSGRPYLPCPDITGDGLEDRRPFLSQAVLTVRAADPLYGDSDLEKGGDCYRNKGLVPWKTLNVPGKDPWGNRYTYRVDVNFSNAAVGFDQETRADQGRYTRPLALTTIAAGATIAARRTSPGGDLVRPRPAAGAVASVWANDLFDEDAPSIVCVSAPCPGSPLIAGEIAAAVVTARAGGYDSPGAGVILAVGQVVSGVPVVILSHGQNGHGAAKSSNIPAVVCNAVPDGRADEAQNAYLANPGATGCGGGGISVFAAGGRQNGFVARPRVDRVEGRITSFVTPGGVTMDVDVKGVQEFDDVVSWMSTEELIAAMRDRGTLPVDLLPPIGLEDH